MGGREATGRATEVAREATGRATEVAREEATEVVGGAGNRGPGGFRGGLRSARTCHRSVRLLR